MINDPIHGNLRAIQDRVIVSHMDFGEQVTIGGIIIPSDDGKTHGVHPRWGCVYRKGSKNNEPYQEGDWVLVEHGRWTRSFIFHDNETDHDLELRMVDADAVIMYSDKKPEFLAIGEEYQNGDSFSSEQFTQHNKLF